MTDREIIFQILQDIYQNGAYANLSLGNYLKKQALSDVQRRFVTEVVYGTVKLGDTLLWQIGKYSRLPLKKLQPAALLILRMSFYQLFYLDKIPPSAVCNEAVKLAKRHGNIGMARFINGILRTAGREPERASLAQLKQGTLEYYTLVYYHPRWIVELFQKEFGIVNSERLCAFDNTNAPLCLRCNLLLNTREELMQSLAAANVVCQPSQLCPDVLVCTSHPAITQIAPLQDGRAIIQDEGSALVAHILAPQPQELIIDCCSAPGGKAMHIAGLMGNTGKVIANDIYAHKMVLIENNAQKLGLQNIETSQVDARLLGERYSGKADRVLADVPCSGFGVLRRKVDARWRKQAKEVAALPQLQYEILCSAAQAVKLGGTLVYSTCTILRQENEAVIERFLAERHEFVLEEQRLLLPYETKTDGFFIAKLRRKQQ